MTRVLVLVMLLIGMARADNPDITVSYDAQPSAAAQPSIKLTFKQNVPPASLPRILHVFLVGPSGRREITSGLIGISLSAGKTVEVDIAKYDMTAPQYETQVEVIISNPDADVTGPIVLQADTKKTLANIQSSLAQQVGSEKATDEKALFAGMAVTVPSGKGDSQGGADLVFNKQFYAAQVLSGALFDSAKVGFTLKKNSAQAADSRHFVAGIDMQKTFLFHVQQLRNVKNLINSGDSGQAQTALGQLPHYFWPSLFFDNGVSFEGDVRSVSIGDISNLVFNSQLKFASSTASFGQYGVFFMRVIPAGVEAGYNLHNSDAPSLDGRSIARLKSGGTVTLRYNSASNNFLSRIDLELNAVDRYLFLHELTTDPKTNTVTLLEKGNKYYAEGNLKFYFSKIGMGRPGFRVSFKRGFLPPVFAFTKAFDAGFFFESSDDKTAAK